MGNPCTAVSTSPPLAEPLWLCKLMLSTLSAPSNQSKWGGSGGGGFRARPQGPVAGVFEGWPQSSHSGQLAGHVRENDAPEREASE